MQKKKMSPKVVRVRRQTYTSIIPKIISCYRHPVAGYPTHEVIHSFGTYHSNEVGIAHVRQTFWNSVDLVLLHLQLSRGLTASDAARIRERFAEVIPVPFVLASPPAVKAIDPTRKADLLKKFPVLASGK